MKFGPWLLRRPLCSFLVLAFSISVSVQRAHLDAPRSGV